MTDDDYKAVFKLPFGEASSFFQDKLNIPTDKWDDLWKEQHAKGFMSAGAAKADLLSDLRGEVQKAIDGETTLAEFQAGFDKVVAKNGWSYNGSRNWRSELIYDTNITTAYQAGRWQQFVDAGTEYLMYLHMDGVAHPRLEHVAWSGTVLPITDPWWNTHYPPNGWRCHCRAVRAERADWAKAQADDQGTAPTLTSDTTGIDEGWDYNVGKAAYGNGPKDDPTKWLPLDYPQAKSGKPDVRIPVDQIDHSVGAPTPDRASLVQAVRDAIGGKEATYVFDQGGLQFGLHVDASWLGEHLPLDRGAYLPFLTDLVQRPAEVWLNWEQNEDSGKIRLGMNILKAIKLGKDKGLFMAAKVAKGEMEGWTFYPTNDMKYFDTLRKGLLVYQRLK